MSQRLVNRWHRRSFTLLELLVVVAIIAVLLLATIPAVNSLSHSGNRKATASLITSTIEQGRAQAIKDARATYVVFPAEPINSNSSITDSKLLNRYFYHSVAIFEDDPTDSTKPKVQVTPWKVFPDGVSLRTDISFSAPAPPATTTSNASWTSDIAFAFTPAGSTATQNFPYMKFDESGTLVAPTPVNAGSMNLRFFDGFVTGTYEHPTNKANRDETISIASTTGRAEYVP